MQGLGAQLASLQADFEYNLGLLEGRDTELQQCEQALVGAGAELAAKLDLIAQMQQALAEAEQGKLLRGALACLPACLTSLCMPCPCC